MGSCDHGWSLYRDLRCASDLGLLQLQRIERRKKLGKGLAKAPEVSAIYDTAIPIRRRQTASMAVTFWSGVQEHGEPASIAGSPLRHRSSLPRPWLQLRQRPNA